MKIKEWGVESGGRSFWEKTYKLGRKVIMLRWSAYSYILGSNKYSDVYAILLWDTQRDNGKLDHFDHDSCSKMVVIKKYRLTKWTSSVGQMIKEG
jgi:hypothetical protein